MELAALKRELPFLTLELFDKACSLFAVPTRAEEVDPVVQPCPTGRDGALLLLQVRELISIVSRFGVHATSIGSTGPFRQARERYAWTTPWSR
jgi:hypothetical protein